MIPAPAELGGSAVNRIRFECIGNTFENITQFVEIKREDQFVLSIIEFVQLDKFNLSQRYIIEIEYH